MQPSRLQLAFIALMHTHYCDRPYTIGELIDSRDACAELLYSCYDIHPSDYPDADAYFAHTVEFAPIGTPVPVTTTH